MKRVLSLAGILIVIAAIIGCQKPEPQASTLIKPEDGAVFDTLPPTFIWSSDELADDYVIRIYMGSSTDIQDTLSDTTYAMSKTLFETLLNGTYNWLAAAMSEDGELFWSESWSFVVDKPEEPQGLDLDTTYFPFGLGYEWCYERHVFGFEISDTLETWDWYDTTSSQVIDSFWNHDTLIVELDNSFAHLSNPVKIFQNKLVIGGHHLTDTISLVPIPNKIEDIIDHGWSIESFSLYTNYNLDTLVIGSSYYQCDIDGTDQTTKHQHVKRVRLIGETYKKKYKSIAYGSGGPEYENTTISHLLYFYNGQDTVYEAD